MFSKNWDEIVQNRLILDNDLYEVTFYRIVILHSEPI